MGYLKVTVLGAIIFAFSICFSLAQQGIAEYPLDEYKDLRKSGLWKNIDTIDFTHVNNRFSLYSQALLSLDTYRTTPYKKAKEYRARELLERAKPALKKLLDTTYLLPEEIGIAKSVLFQIDELRKKSKQPEHCKGLSGEAEKACLIQYYSKVTNSRPYIPQLGETGGGGVVFQKTWDTLLKIDYESKPMTDQDVDRVLESNNLTMDNISISKGARSITSIKDQHIRKKPDIDVFQPSDPRVDFKIDSGSIGR